MHKRYFPGSSNVPDPESKEWYKVVHGAYILKDVFAEFAGDGNDYDKVKHGLALTRHLIDNPTSHIQEITRDLVAILKPNVT